MSFQNYNLNNNARWTLLSSITASSVSIVLNSWYGALFPASNFLITVEQLDTTVTPNVVTKREIIKVVTRTWDTFNITGWRWFWTCTPSDSSTTPWTTAFAFDDWDRVSQYMPSEVTKDMKDEIVRLWSSKLDIWAIRTWLSNIWSFFYSNWSGWETALTMWANTTVLTSNWATAAPSWQSPTVNISGLWEDTAPTTSYFAVLFSWATNVKTSLTNLTKWLRTATTTLTWIIRQATDAEVITWTDTTACISSAQAKNNYWTADVITLTRVGSTASSTVTYSHWLWRIPKTIHFNMWTTDTSYAFSNWSYANSKNSCINQTSWIAWLLSTDKCINWGNNAYYAVCNNLTTTWFDLVWTKVWSPAGTFNVVATLL